MRIGALGFLVLPREGSGPCRELAGECFVAFGSSGPAGCGRLRSWEAVGISVLSGGFKTLPGWLEISLVVSVGRCC